MSNRYEIKRIVNIKTPDGADAVFYEVWGVINVDGEQGLHRNHDRAFKTDAEAQAWIEKQTQ